LSYYLDTSAIVPLYFPEETSAALARWIRDAEPPLVISDFAVAEFSSALSRNIRMGLLAEAEAQKLIVAFDEWRDDECTSVEIQPVDIYAATRLVQKPHPKLLTPDAIHLAVSKRLGLIMVSLDADLVAHARARQIPAVVPN
jgi:uncharacterized protein